MGAPAWFTAKTDKNESRLNWLLVTAPRYLPVQTFIFFLLQHFSGSNSELPWKCESILLSAWEVGCEIAHLHLKQQALLSGAQNRPVETGWKWTLVLHPGCIWSKIYTGVCWKAKNGYIQHVLFSGFYISEQIGQTHAGSQQHPIIILFFFFTPSKPSYITISIKGSTWHIFLEFIPCVNYSCTSWPICISKEERVELKIVKYIDLTRQIICAAITLPLIAAPRSSLLPFLEWEGK